MASRAEDVNRVVVPIDGEEPTITLHEWFELARSDGRVDLGVRAAQLLAEARAEGEV
ncbi:MAG: hypothetical protein ACRDL3_02840 [Solirubrobacterales bacterium]